MMSFLGSAPLILVNVWQIDYSAGPTRYLENEVILNTGEWLMLKNKSICAYCGREIKKAENQDFSCSVEHMVPNAMLKNAHLKKETSTHVRDATS